MISPTQRMLGLPPGIFPGQFVFLDSPVRILDTRVGFSAYIRPNAPIVEGTTTTWPLKFPGSGIPADAIGLMCLLTAVNLTGANKFLTIYPAHRSQPITSSFNFRSVIQVQNLFMPIPTAPFLVAGVNTAGAVSYGDTKIFCSNPASGTTLEFVIDVTGYVLGDVAR